MGKRRTTDSGAFWQIAEKINLKSSFLIGRAAAAASDLVIFQTERVAHAYLDVRRSVGRLNPCRPLPGFTEPNFSLKPHLIRVLLDKIRRVHSRHGSGWVRQVVGSSQNVGFKFSPLKFSFFFFFSEAGLPT